MTDDEPKFKSQFKEIPEKYKGVCCLSSKAHTQGDILLTNMVNESIVMFVGTDGQPAITANLDTVEIAYLMSRLVRNMTIVDYLMSNECKECKDATNSCILRSDRAAVLGAISGFALDILTT